MPLCPSPPGLPCSSARGSATTLISARLVPSAEKHHRGRREAPRRAPRASIGRREKQQGEHDSAHLSYPPRMPGDILVGRDEELARATRTLDSALTGGGQMILLSGEAGIGKSRLAEAIAAMVAEREGRVVWGRCW